VNEIWNGAAQEFGTNLQVIGHDREKWEEIVLVVKIFNRS